MKDLSTIIEVIQKLANNKNLSVNKILQESGAGKDLIANIRKGQIPSITKILDLADYLDCSIDYILGRTDNPEINK